MTRNLKQRGYLNQQKVAMILPSTLAPREVFGRSRASDGGVACSNIKTIEPSCSYEKKGSIGRYQMPRHSTRARSRLCLASCATTTHDIT